jgi:hypothetical protein
MRLLIALLLVPGAALAGGWVQPTGAGYLKVDTRYLAAQRGYPAAGAPSKPTGGRYVDWAWRIYGEWGVTDDWTAVLSASPLGVARFDDGAGVTVADATPYVGPIGGGARYALLKGRVNLAVEGRYSWAPPVGDSIVGAGAYVCEDEPSPCGSYFWRPTVSAHHFDADLQAGIGLPVGFWFSGTVGGRGTLGADLSPVLRLDGQLGWQGWGVLKWLVVEAHVRTWLPAGDITEDDLAGAGQTRYIGTGYSMSAWLTPRFALQVGRDGARAVRSNAAAPVYAFGVELRTR